MNLRVLERSGCDQDGENSAAQGGQKGNLSPVRCKFGRFVPICGPQVGDGRVLGLPSNVLECLILGPR